MSVHREWMQTAKPSLTRGLHLLFLTTQLGAKNGEKIKPNCNYAWNVPSSSYPSVRCCLASTPSSLLLYQNCNLEGTGSSLYFYCLLSGRLNTFVQRDIRKKVMCVHKNEQVNGSICYSRIPLFYKTVVSFWPFIASSLSRVASLPPVLSDPKVVT